MSQLASRTVVCPSCGATIAADERFPVWCECGWNLKPPETRAAAQGPLARAYAAVGARVGDRLVAELREATALEPRTTPAKAGAYAIAGAVHALTLALFFGGIALTILAYPHVVLMILTAMLVGVALLMRPRAHEMPEGAVVERSDAPRLYALVDEVAAALEVDSVDAIVVNHEFNAEWRAVGWRRRRVLTLGMPLFAALEPQERAALIAHELAHGRNGDATRGFVVGSAIHGLAALYGILVQEESLEGQSALAIFEVATRGVLWVLAQPIRGLLYLELHLLLRDSQRAEFLADALAARAAGTDAVVSLHEKALLHPTFEFLVHRRAHARDQNGADLFEELRRELDTVPERERERRRRVARLEQTRLDASHPPTAHRIELLEAHRVDRAVVTTDDAATAEIDRELARLRGELERKLVDGYRDALY